MEILADMMKIIKKIDADNQMIMKNATNFEEFKKPDIESEKVSNILTRILKEQENTVAKISENKAYYKQTIENIPKSITSIKEIQINFKTFVWLLIVFFSIIVGFLFAPKIVQDAEFQILKIELENKKKKIENFKIHNPKVHKKYFE